MVRDVCYLSGSGICSAAVVSLIHPDNAPSIRVAEHLGQTVEGQTEVLTMPVLIYGIDRARWRAGRSTR